MKTKTWGFRLYAKEPGSTRFAPMDYAAGHQVINLIFATVFNADQAAKLRAELPALHKQNTGWSFELRAVKGGF